MKFGKILLLLFMMISCNSPDKYIDMLDRLDPADDIGNYQLRLGYSSLVMSNMLSYEEGISAVKKLIELNSYPEARYCLEYIAGKFGDNAEIQFHKAVCYRNEYQYRNASDAIVEAISLDGNVMKYMEEKKRIDRESAVWSQIETLNSSLAKGSNASELTARAELFIELGQYLPAVYDLKRSVALDSTVFETRYLLGRVNLLLSEYGEAADIFSRLAELPLTEDKKRTSELYASAAQSLRDFAESIASDPQDVQLYINISRELSLMGEHMSALKIIDKGLSVNKNDIRLLQVRILVLIQLGEMQQAKHAADIIESMGHTIDPQLKQILR